MRLFALGLALGACASDAVLVGELRADEATTLLVRGAELHLVDRARPTFLDPELGAPVLLHYARPLEELLLEAGLDGRVVLAGAADDPEDTWTLPPPGRGERYDAERGAWAPLSSAELAAEAARFRVPATPCGGFRVGPTARVQRDSTVSLVGMASAGEVALVVESDDPGTGRVLRVVDGQVLPLALAPDVPLRRWVLTDGDTLLVVGTSSGGLTVDRVAPDGTITEVARRRASLRNVGAVAHALGTRTLLLRSASIVRRFDLDSGELTTLHDFGPAVSDAPCDIVKPTQAFLADGASSGYTSVVLDGLYRFDEAGAAKLLEVELPCSSGYARFDGETELVYTRIAEHQGSSARFDWRPSAREPWRTEPASLAIQGALLLGEHTVVLDTDRDEAFLLGREPRRPDQRPRICDRLPIADIRELSYDGAVGYALSRDGLEYSLTRYSIRSDRSPAR